MMLNLTVLWQSPWCHAVPYGWKIHHLSFFWSMIRIFHLPIPGVDRFSLVSSKNLMSRMNQEDQITTQPYPIQLSSWTYGSSSHLKGCYRCYRGCVHPGSEAHGAMSRQIRHSIGRASHQQRENLAGKSWDLQGCEGVGGKMTLDNSNPNTCLILYTCAFSSMLVFHPPFIILVSTHTTTFHHFSI